jgi:prepilin-type N-terminal cleavage/methylation domain-containing protein
MRFKSLNSHGYTLIEIIIVIVILGIIGGISFQFVGYGVEAFKKSSARKELYDQGRLALERMVRELRDAKEVEGSSSSSITFKKAHPDQAADYIEEIKFQLNGTNLERVGNPSGTPATAVLASNVSGFTVTGVTSGGGSGTCTIAIDSQSSGSADGASSLTFSHTIGGGSNRILVVGVSIETCNPYETVSSITYGGKTLTYLNSAQVTSSNDCRGRVELYYLLEADMPGAGPFNVVVTATGWCDALAAGAVSLRGVAQQAPEVSNTNANDAQTSISTNITTLTDGAWLVDAVHSGNPGTFTANSGQNVRYDQASSTSEVAGSTLLVASAGNVSLGWTNTSANRLAQAVAAFAPATGCSTGGGGTTLFSDDFEDGVITGWSKASGMDMAESGGVFTTTGNNTSHYTVDAGSSWADYSFNVDAMANDNDVVGITFRVEDSDSFYVFQQTFGDGNWNLRLRLYDNGSSSTLASIDNYGSNPGQVNSETTWYNFKVEVSGTNIKAYLDNVLKFDINDATFSEGTVGLWLSSSGGTDFDNVLVQSPGGNLVTLELTLSSSEGGTVTMRTMVFMRNMP